MNVFGLAHQVNGRLYGGDESKFDMIFIIVNEILFAFKDRYDTFEGEMISEGEFDDNIMLIIELYMDDIDLKDELSMIYFFREKFFLSFGDVIVKEKFVTLFHYEF